MHSALYANRPAAFGPLLRYWRDVRGVTQSMLAEAVGEQHTSISNYETGVRGPSAEVLVALRRVLAIPREMWLEFETAGFIARAQQDHDLAGFVERQAALISQLNEERRQHLETIGILRERLKVAARLIVANRIEA